MKRENDGFRGILYILIDFIREHKTSPANRFYLLARLA